jgi:hypothetical protein
LKRSCFAFLPFAKYKYSLGNSEIKESNNRFFKIERGAHISRGQTDVFT